MPNKFPRKLCLVAAALVMTMTAAAPAGAIEATTDISDEPAEASAKTESSLALYKGTVIDLSEDWEGAQTCVVAPERLLIAECFDTDAERDDRLLVLGIAHLFEEAPAPEGASFAFASCSSYLRLYDGTYYGGASLWLSARRYWVNLSSYGFNQRASSYKVGGCSSYMADYSNGGGAWISTSLTQAWDVDAVISGSWNNDVSSVYIT